MPADADRDVPPPTVFKKDQAVYQKLNDAIKADFDSLVAVQTRQAWDRFAAEMVSSFAKADGSFLQVVRQTKNYAFSFPVDRLPQPFAKPSLILIGRQDSTVGYKDTYKFIEQYPRASFVVLDMCGHALQIEQVELFNALVNEWLDSILWFFAFEK